MTKEHIFANWLRAIFPRDASTTHTHGTIVWPVAGSPPAGPVTSAARKQGHSGSRKVRVVCDSCNNGWLSTAVEDVTRPILEPRIQGQGGSINPQEQRLLATWAAKTVMTAEYVKPGKPVVHQAERTSLKDNLSPPAGWYIWLTSYSGNQWRDLGIFQHASELEIPAVDNTAATGHNLELTFIGIGQLMFLVMNSSWQHIRDILEGMGAPGFNRIWPNPAATIQWPTAALTDVEAEYFTTYLARVLTQPV